MKNRKKSNSNHNYVDVSFTYLKGAHISNLSYLSLMVHKNLATTYNSKWIQQLYKTQQQIKTLILNTKLYTK